MKNLLPLSVIACLSLTLQAIAAPEYEIEAASNEETFIINGEVFKAQTDCIGWDKGDRVIFLEGDPLGGCTSAKLYNRRTEETCDLWCE